jgi:hypothetical protein
MPDVSTEVAIATTTLSSATGSISFTSIPATYTDLRVVMVGTMVNTEQPYIGFNSDSGTNYSSTYLWGSGSSAGSSRFTGANRIYVAPLSNWSTTNAQMATIDVFSYAGSTFKTTLFTGSNDNNGSGGVDRTVGLWRSTSAITQIDIIGNGQNFSTGFTATLYGIL